MYKNTRDVKRKVNVMKVIDIHAHIYEKVAGITQGQPMSSTSQGKGTIGNREIQFLPPSFIPLFFRLHPALSSLRIKNKGR